MFVVVGFWEEEVIGVDSGAACSQQFDPLIVLVVLDGEPGLDELGEGLLVGH